MPARRWRSRSAIALGACAGTTSRAPSDPRAIQAQSCRQLYRLLDARIEQAGIADAQYARIEGFPYLRIDRFLAAAEFAPDPGGGEFDLWVAALRDLDLQARAIELENLPLGTAPAGVDASRPVVFRRISHTRFEGRTLLQLNYSVWFPARPPSGDFDLLSGRLDGITFRVTLDAEGRALIYDSMHNCGCYHLFVPTTRLQRKAPGAEFEEPALVAQHLKLQKGRVVLRIAHGSHYLQRVYFDASTGEGEVYAMRDDGDLRSLPMADGGRRSLFAPDGIVAGSERWLFRPMGIAEPGAMRQWGRHVTAFVGTRHFDDAHLIERYFVSVP